MPLPRTFFDCTSCGYRMILPLVAPALPSPVPCRSCGAPPDFLTRGLTIGYDPDLRADDYLPAHQHQILTGRDKERPRADRI